MNELDYNTSADYFGTEDVLGDPALRWPTRSAFIDLVRGMARAGERRGGFSESASRILAGMTTHRPGVLLGTLPEGRYTDLQWSRLKDEDAKGHQGGCQE